MLPLHLARNLCSAIRNSKICTIKNGDELQKFLRKQSNYVSEEEVVLGPRQETRLKFGRPMQVCVKQACYFVPISNVLKNMLLKNDNVLDQIFSYNEILRKVTNQGLLIDIQQAKSFENNGTPFDLPPPEGLEMTPHPFKLSLQLYSDDSEPADAIGSRRTKHKSTCFYWILKNPHLWLTQQSRAVNVAAICKTLDLQRYSYKLILSSINKDLESLEEPFNVVSDEGTKITITGAEFSFVVDNAEYYSALGFVKSFSKAFCCERCLTTVDDFSKHFEQSKCLLRSFKSFTKNDEKTGLNLQPSKGVRAKSHLETKYFSACRN